MAPRTRVCEKGDAAGLASAACKADSALELPRPLTIIPSAHTVLLSTVGWSVLRIDAIAARSVFQISRRDGLKNISATTRVC